MKTSAIFVVVAGASLAAAQLDKLPTCALSCAISSIGSSGCSQTDIACVCSASSFLSGIQTCIEGSCTAQEIKQTLDAAQVLCAGAGVTITLPGSGPTTTEAPTSSSSVPSVATEATSTAPSTTVVVTTSEASAAESSSSATASFAASEVVTMTTTTSICPTSTAHVVPPPVNNATGVVPAPPTYTGAASNMVASAGTVIIGAALAMLFA
ncbi:hypothetical protein Dda_5682 [Drechslerella dactyloides]|uniref:CFEM domain-containing protein n=1 Tax=Drechslerella dactyloides TaxID=74499 RepID=A0AAD6NHS3_DREDA|nr:hypothetical protein Dda_5682 [Drechslerella dactyloides]